MKSLVIKPGRRRYGRVVVPSSKSIAHQEIIVLRALPVVEAAAAIALYDALLLDNPR